MCVCVYVCLSARLFFTATAGNPQPNSQGAPPQESLQPSPKSGRDSVSPTPSPCRSPQPSRDFGSPAVPPRAGKSSDSPSNSYRVPNPAAIANFHLPTPPGTPDMRGGIPMPVDGVECLPTHPGAPLRGEHGVVVCIAFSSVLVPREVHGRQVSFLCAVLCCAVLCCVGASVW